MHNRYCTAIHICIPQWYSNMDTTASKHPGTAHAGTHAWALGPSCEWDPPPQLRGHRGQNHCKCCRIEQLADEARAVESARNEDQNTIRHLEHRVSHKNIASLEQTTERLRAELRDRAAEIESLKGDLASGKPVEMAPKESELVFEVIADTLAELGCCLPVDGDVPIYPY